MPDGLFRNVRLPGRPLAGLQTSGNSMSLTSKVFTVLPECLFRLLPELRGSGQLPGPSVGASANRGSGVFG